MNKNEAVDYIIANLTDEQCLYSNLKKLFPEAIKCGGSFTRCLRLENCCILITQDVQKKVIARLSLFGYVVAYEDDDYIVIVCDITESVGYELVNQISDIIGYKFDRDVGIELYERLLELSYVENELQNFFNVAATIAYELLQEGVNYFSLDLTEQNIRTDACGNLLPYDPFFI